MNTDDGVSTPDILVETDNPDYALTARLRAKYSYDLGGDQDVKFVTFLNTYSKLYEDFGQVDFNFLAAKIGFEGADGPYDWRVTFDAKNLDVAGDQYLKEFGIDLRMRRELTPRTSVQLDADYGFQYYDDIIIGDQPTLLEEFRTGEKYTGLVSLNHKFTSQIRGSAGIGYQHKAADFEAYEYEAFLATVSGSKTFKNGAYAVASYFYRDLEYAEPDFTVIAVDPTTPAREEDRHYVRGAVGIPIGAVIKTGNVGLQNTLDDLVIEGSIFHDERQANFDIYDYENTGGEIQLVWRFNR